MCNMYPAEPKTEAKGGAGGGHTLSSRADTYSSVDGKGRQAGAMRTEAWRRPRLTSIKGTHRVSIAPLSGERRPRCCNASEAKP